MRGTLGRTFQRSEARAALWITKKDPIVPWESVNQRLDASAELFQSAVPMNLDEAVEPALFDRSPAAPQDGDLIPFDIQEENIWNAILPGKLIDRDARHLHEAPPARAVIDLAVQSEVEAQFTAGLADCGAHVMLARMVGPAGRVVAVEANPYNASVARRNRALNALDQIGQAAAVPIPRPVLRL